MSDPCTGAAEVSATGSVMTGGTFGCCAAVVITALAVVGLRAQSLSARLGDERAVRHHLTTNQEFELSVSELVEVGRRLFTANWTVEDGAGRPLSKGTGKAL